MFCASKMQSKGKNNNHLCYLCPAQACSFLKLIKPSTSLVTVAYANIEAKRVTNNAKF